MRRPWKRIVLLLMAAFLCCSCATPPTPMQIARWKALAQVAVVALHTADKISEDDATALVDLIETGKLKESKALLARLSEGGRLTTAEALGILSFVNLLQAANSK